VLLSVGASYRFDERLSVDVAYQHAFLADGKVRIGRGSPQLASANIPGLGPTDLTFAGSVRGSADIVSVALRYRFD
jgi:long-chain fatty acid transport protein